MIYEMITMKNLRFCMSIRLVIIWVIGVDRVDCQEAADIETELFPDKANISSLFSTPQDAARNKTFANKMGKTK